MRRFQVTLGVRSWIMREEEAESAEEAFDLVNNGTLIEGDIANQVLVNAQIDEKDYQVDEVTPQGLVTILDSIYDNP